MKVRHVLIQFASEVLLIGAIVFSGLWLILK